MTRATIHSLQKLIAIAAFGVMGFAATAQADALNRCARYGADFAPVAGSAGCVRLGGHVRASSLAPMSYAAPDGVQPAAARIAQQPLAAFELFRR